MGWFSRFCRNTGLMIHHVVRPYDKTQRQQVSRTVEEQKIDRRVTLRRTTIDEVEIKQRIDIEND